MKGEILLKIITMNYENPSVEAVYDKDGKIADFTVLKENPYEVDPLKIGHIEVVTTYLSGKNTDEL